MSTFFGGGRSIYETATVGYQPNQDIEEILIHPCCDFKKGVTIAAGSHCINVGDVLGQITSAGPNMGKFTLRVSTASDGSQVPICIAARPAAMANYDPNFPNDNNILDTDFAIDAIFKGIVKASAVHGISSADYASFGIIDLRPYQDVLILR